MPDVVAAASFDKRIERKVCALVQVRVQRLQCGTLSKITSTAPSGVVGSSGGVTCDAKSVRLPG